MWIFILIDFCTLHTRNTTAEMHCENILDSTEFDVDLKFSCAHNTHTHTRVWKAPAHIFYLKKRVTCTLQHANEIFQVLYTN